MAILPAGPAGATVARPFVCGLDIRADLTDEVAFAFGAAVADLGVQRERRRKPMLDAQPDPVVVDRGAAIRFLEPAADVGVQRLPVAATEQARFRVDDRFAARTGAPHADVVGIGAGGEAERDIRAQRGAEEAREIGTFPTFRKRSSDVGETGECLTRPVRVVQRDGAGLGEFVVVWQG